ncbi:MAG TPA: hypothetical protein VF612_06225 [Jatrophihabitans sp.]|uniref:hypothetical protein n=1 Tax=Jatrophihabitans sp. TaxID=1932789 RepID=UPI002F01EA15
MWSLLPPKYRSAGITAPIPYSEADDRQFMDQFLRLRDSQHPYFDPFTRAWLPAGFFHSNMATYRKNTFVRSWGAAEWDGNHLQLSPNYSLIFASKVLTKAGSASRIPALACAIFFYKRPSAEWGPEHPFAAGVPDAPDALVQQFRADFSFEADSEWTPIFDPDPSLVPEYHDLLRTGP